MLEPILQQVGAGNPQLAQLIGDNPDQFLQLLSEDSGEDTPLPPGAQEISVTEEERDAIERVSLPELFSSRWGAFADLLSYVAWASSAIRSFRLTLRVIRTRRWQRTFCLINLMMRRKGVLDGSRFLDREKVQHALSGETSRQDGSNEWPISKTMRFQQWHV